MIQLKKFNKDYPIEKISLLVVDDEELIRGLLVEFLDDKVDVLYTAKDGMDALDVISKHKIDIVLSDVNMPRMDGGELFRQLNDDGFTGEVIFLTAYADKSFTIEVMREGAFDVIDKPIIEDVLTKRIEHAKDHVLAKRYERKLLLGLTKFLEYKDPPESILRDSKQRQKYLEGVLAMLEIKTENNKQKKKTEKSNVAK